MIEREDKHSGSNQDPIDDKGLHDHVMMWLDTKAELLKVILIERIAVFSGSMALIAFLVFFGVVTIAFVAVTLALLIAQWLDSTVWGFAIVALIYLICFVLLAWRGRIMMRELVVDWLVAELMQDKSEKNED